MNNREPHQMVASDPCPACGEPIRPAVQATAQERAEADPRSDRNPLPPHYDTASLEQIAEHGPLHRCTKCDFSVRIKPTSAGDAYRAPRPA